ncbi:type IV secretion system DNA-binding domain-containing protein [Candidatus Peregrinibacteria bacterium]|nr:type IV secretion system DNA-binding domain-containing protein [Candidatus Peregrinibacteria bacterium]
MDFLLTTLLGLISAGALVSLGLFIYRRLVNYKRSINMVFLKILVPLKESKDDREREQESHSKSSDFKEVIGIMSQFYQSLHSIYSSDFSNKFKGQNFLSFEYAVLNSEINFYIVCPRELVSLIEKQLTSFYPDCFVEQVEDYNIFQPRSKTGGTYMKLSKDYVIPFKTHTRLNSDPINAIINVLSKFKPDEGAAIQIMVRPKKNGWQKKGRKMAEGIFNKKNKRPGSPFNPITWIRAFFDMMVNNEKTDIEKPDTGRTTPAQEEEVKAIEEKNTQSGYEAIIRVIVSSNSKHEVKTHLTNIKSAFAQYSTPDGNSFKDTKWHSDRELVKDFIFRGFKRSLAYSLKQKMAIFSCDELASLFHVPNITYNKSSVIAWQRFKIAPAPINVPNEGILLGYNKYRGETKEIRLKNEDRFRHFYVIGQTGTGKSSILQVMIRQDLENGNGLCIVDPHGQLIEDIIPFIPRSRADDVIYFNPADLERPIGINVLEADTPEEKELVAMDAMNIMIKLFGEEVFGPRIQDYFRNGCLTLLEDPEGGALTDMVRLFTDDEYQKLKVEHVKNPIVRSFWEHQMAKTGAREKQEMIPYFAAKFGQFVTNTMMRNIIGQTKSSFDFSEAMNSKKILLMNLSKGTTGEINSKLLGMLIVQKLQMAALRRQRESKGERKDFFLYVDEFQNYVTESIETILSEARKYRLGLIMAHQYIKQLEGEDGKSKVKDAVFGNVGTMMCYKIGATDAEYMAKEMAPVFSDQDLINLDKFKAVIKLSIDSQPSRPFSITPVNPYLEKGDTEIAEAIKQLSRLTYGREKSFVDREILRRIGAIF